MIRDLRFAKHVVLAVVVMLTGDGFAQTESVDSLYADLQGGLGKISSGDSTKLESQYVEALKALQDATAKTGDLDRTLMVRDEIAGYQGSGLRDYENFPKLALLRSTYEKSQEKFLADLTKSRLTVLKIYEERFSMLKKSLTADEKIDQAVRANRFLDVIRKGIADPSNLSELTALWVWRGIDDVQPINDAVVDRKSGRFVISSQRRTGSMVRTRAMFTAPYEVFARMTTDSVNIRFYLGSRVVAIFNWEVSKDQLRIHDPTNVVKPRGIKGKGYLKENEMHDIRMVVKKDKISIYADDELRGEVASDFSNLKEQVGIGPAFGSRLSVESWKVLPLPEQAGGNAVPGVGD